MRPVRLGSPIGASVDAKLEWIMRALKEIENASQVDGTSATAKAYQPANVSEQRAFDVSTATLPDIGNVLGTLINDLGRGGPKRT